MVETGLAEPNRAARIEIGGNHHELSVELSEVVAATPFGEDLLEIGPQGFAAKKTDREGAREPTERLEEPSIAWVAQDIPESFEEQSRDLGAAADKIAHCGRHEGLGYERVLSRFVFDDGSAQLGGREIVHQACGNEGARADTDIDVEIVEIDAVEGLVECADGPDLVDGSFGATARQSDADLGCGAGRIDHARLPVCSSWSNELGETG
jgi:hypothetical protein